MIDQRASGILAHITSLPSPYGIGDIGNTSYEFIDFLVACDQSYWQILPTGPIHSPFDYSPYMSSSAFAGSYLLISPELLAADGLLLPSRLAGHPDFSPYLSDYPRVEEFKKVLLQEAFASFQPDHFPEYREFVSTSRWLNDYAMFMTAKEVYHDAAWYDWPRELATRSESGMKTFSRQYAERINYFRFEQFEFFRQWHLLHEYARENHIRLFGDLPIYVSFDSVDVWANQEIFTLDRKTLRPTHVSGVPPDYFSKTGQRWGTALYRWQSDDQLIQQNLLQWWTDRLAHLFSLMDIVRIDHFRGFESYWSIPEECATAVDGRWLKGPGKGFFDRIADTLGPVNIVAEDLGIITAEVEHLRDDLGFPGMKVLQFAFDGNLDNSFLPHNFTSTQNIIYTGTHDNDTTIGWFLSDSLTDWQRDYVKQIANRDAGDQRDPHHDLIYLAQASISVLCIFPLQDILGFGGDCRMNTPGVATGNWRWRCSSEFLTARIADELRTTTQRFHRGNKAREKKTGHSG